jgi:hypothetical protein
MRQKKQTSIHESESAGNPSDDAIVDDMQLKCFITVYRVSLRENKITGTLCNLSNLGDQSWSRMEYMRTPFLPVGCFSFMPMRLSNSMLSTRSFT